MKKVKVHLHLDHGRSPGPRAADMTAAQVEEAVHYGFGHAEPWINLNWSQDRVESRTSRFFRRGSAFILGFDLIHAYSNRAAMSEAEVIWTRTAHETLAVALLKKLHLINRRTRILAGAIWLWDLWPKRPVRRQIYRWLLAEVALNVAQSPVNTAAATAALGRRVALLPYGMDEQSFGEPLRRNTTGSRADSDIHVVAPGNDRDRDWRTLVSATVVDPRIRVTVLSRRIRPRVAAMRSQRVRTRRVLTKLEMQEEYSRADVIAIPLKSNLHNSGATVAFEAIMAERPVVVTKTGGIEFYLNSGAHWVAVDDAEGFAAGICSAAEEPPEKAAAHRRNLVERGLTLRDYALRHVIGTWYVMGYHDDLRAIEETRPIEAVVRTLSANVPS